MDKYEVAIMPVSEWEVNKEIARRQEDGWKLVPPILFKEAVWTREQYPSPISEAQMILTFQKES